MAVQPAESLVRSLEQSARVNGQAYDSSAFASTEQAWMALLELMPYQPRSRLVYCFAIKRCFDIAFALTLLVVLSPLLLLVALAVRIDCGKPIIFKHHRIGRNGKPFMMYKFRTMIPDRRKQQLPFEGLDRRKSHKTRHDPRVTRLGRILRATSIDELPQLINIVRGDMSFVGPRPEMPEIVDRYAAWQHQRHLVRPGLTGWWQVQGRSDLPMHEHTELDLYYVTNQSFRLDLQIVLRTVRVLVRRSGAF
jgi:lipopolysaccharide/colanic/teichoic acid biosynthesis glycosyltransferase